MTHFTSPMKRLLDRAHRRFVRSRPGSVLILVVALLVLMALIGTAFMTMAQFDRAAAVQHTFNTEIELLLDGVVNLTKASVTSDLFVNSEFRPAKPTYNTSAPGQLAYNYYDGLGLDAAAAAAAFPGLPENAGTAFLSARVPELPSTAKGAGTGNWPMWLYVTAPVNGTSQYESPYWPWDATNKVYKPQVYTARYQLSPGQTGIQIDGQTWPAWVNPANGAWAFMAADTDGDGVADAGFFKLLTLEGVTYYAAVRIIDNAAAINANTAWTYNTFATSSTGSAQLPGDFFPSNIDLQGTLKGDNLNSLNTYRFKGATTPSATPYVDPTPIGSTSPTARTDFTFTSAQEAAWMQLGRRLGNPGWGGNNRQYQALSLGDSLALAHNFCLVDASATASQIETSLPNSTRTNLRATPYPPGDIFSNSNWFGNNFNYATNGSANMELRPLLVTHNPVSNFTPNRFSYKGVLQGNTLYDRTGTTSIGTGAFNFGDSVQFAPNSANYVWVGPPGGNAPFPTLGTDSSTWVYEPWTTSPTKTSVNTGSFGQLWVAYWSVMADQFLSGIWQPEFNATSSPSTARMFRSPLRTGQQVIPVQQGAATAPVALTPLQVMQLRSALAAVNTIDLRDADDDVASRIVTLSDPNNANAAMKTVKAIVYGTEMQPYITEVYASNTKSDSNGYVYIELYNPFPKPISLSNWKLVTISRPPPVGATPPSLTLQPLPSTASWTGAAAPVIPAGGYIVLTNTATPPTGFQPPTATAPTSLIVLADLGNALDHELMLLKPRRFDGTISTYTAPANSPYPSFDESKPEDMVPVDSYDFTGLQYPNTDTAHANGIEWHYVRPNSVTGGKAWHWVYPGHYTIGAAAAPGGPAVTSAPPRLIDGTAVGDAGNGDTLNPAKSFASFGDPAGETVAASVGGVTNTKYIDVPIQLNNWDMAGPNNILHGERNAFPFGGFARNGDILQVPFIGAYKIMNVDATQTMELNPVSMDSAFAEDDDPSDDRDPGKNAIENIGRFAPIDGQDFGSGAAVGTAPVDDFAPAPSGGGINPKWRYHFALRLFDFLTVQCPQQDFLPDVDPSLMDPGSATPTKYPGPTPSPVANSTAGINNGQTGNTNFATEELAPVEGLVNINSAPWRVMSAVPWMPVNDPNRALYNIDIARSIAWYRDVDDGSVANQWHPHGPFKTIFELNRVPIYSTFPPYPVAPAAPVPTSPIATFRELIGNTATSDPNSSKGDLSPMSSVGDKVLSDFETRYLMINRVSNLITTRSDSFTAYILIQGWRNAETDSPHLVAQRRAAIIIDRSAVTPVNKTPNVVNVPVD